MGNVGAQYFVEDVRLVVQPTASQHIKDKYFKILFWQIKAK